MKKFKVLLVYPNLMLVSTLPNNIALLTACLKTDGHDVQLFDTTLYRTAAKSNDELRVERMQVRKFNIRDRGVTLKETSIFDDFTSLVDSYKPDLIALTVVTDTWVQGIKLVENAKCQQKGIPVLFGGVHAQFSTNKLIQHPLVDMLCIGEGEDTLRQISQRLKNGESLKGVPNLWYKEKSGEVVKGVLAAPIDLESLPFDDFSLFEEQRFFRPMQGRMVKSVPINFDRGCPYKCSFCAAPTMKDMYKETSSEGHSYFRQKSAKRVFEEMRHQLSLYNIEYFYFNSETFLAISLNRLKEFSEMYADIRLPFWCQTRFETVTEDKIKILKDMNCDRISFGLEHGNEEFRKTILNKNFSNEQVIRGMEICNDYDINVSINNMMGFPGETRELLFDTININRRITADSINGFVVQPYIGTELRKYCVREGLLAGDDDEQGKFTLAGQEDEVGTPVGDAILNMSKMPDDVLKGLVRTFVLYVKMPEEFFPKIKVAEQQNAEGETALNELRDVFFEKYF